MPYRPGMHVEFADTAGGRLQGSILAIREPLPQQYVYSVLVIAPEGEAGRTVLLPHADVLPPAHALAPLQSEALAHAQGEIEDALRARFGHDAVRGYLPGCIRVNVPGVPVVKLQVGWMPVYGAAEIGG